MYSLRCFSLKRQLPFSQVCTFPAQTAEKRSACGRPPTGIRPIAKRFSMENAAPGGIRSIAKHFLMDRCRISAAG